MLRNQDMVYKLLNITDQRFNSISNTIIEASSSLSLLERGSMGLENVDTISILPKNFSLVELNDGDNTTPEILSLVNSLIQEEEQQDLYCTLASYYPAGGFIGWHTNSNYNLYNAICTFSDTGNSFFEYVDVENIINTPDRIGWSVKKTFWSLNNPIKHRAVSNCNRITITFSSKNEMLIDALITKITS